jgi:hypothetical protein
MTSTMTYFKASVLAVDICDTVEFFYRKIPDASTRRVSCECWGVVYLFDNNGTPSPVPPVTTTTAAGTSPVAG